VLLKRGGSRADNVLVMRSRAGGPPDRGDIVLGWLTRLTVLLSLLGVLGFDAVALAVGRLTAEDRAQEAARAAVRAWSDTGDLQRAYEAALAETDGLVDGIAPGSFTVGPDGTVTLTLTHTASTLLVERVGPVRSWATSSATVTGRPAL
jgi:hypothetical protein